MRKLRTELEELRQSPDLSKFAQGADKVELIIREGVDHKRHSVTTSWDELSVVVADAIITAPEEDNIRDSIILSFAEPLEIRRTDEVSSYGLLSHDFKKIKTQLVSLGLVEINYITRTYEDYDRMLGKAMKTGVSLVWKLTRAGEKRYAELAAMHH